MLDGDDAGRQGTLSIAHILAVRMSVSAISLEDGRQPDQLPSREIQGIMRGLWNMKSDAPTLEQRRSTRSLRRPRIGRRDARTGLTVANEFTPLNVALGGGRNLA